MMLKYYPLRYLDVSKYEEGFRLSALLRKHFPKVPQGHWHALIRKGRVRIDGKRTRSHERLREGGVIRIPPLFEEKQSSEKSSEALLEGSHAGVIRSLKLSIIAQNEEILVLNKPAGLACQGGRGISVSVDRLFPFLLKGEGYLVHRLDKETTGALIVAKTRAMAEHLSNLFACRKIHKIYVAVLCNTPSQNQGIWDAPLEDKNGRLRASKTRFTLLQRHSSGLCLVALEPHTGRKRQLRRHGALASVPILGDAKYGGRQEFLLREILGRDHNMSRSMFLHGRAILLEHKRFLAPFPPAFENLCKSLGWSLDKETTTFQNEQELLCA